MSLILSNSQPRATVKSLGTDIDETLVAFNEHIFPMGDFVVMVHYVLTNTDLTPNDPRRRLLESLKAMREVPGYNPGGTRLHTDIEPWEIKP